MNPGADPPDDATDQLADHLGDHGPADTVQGLQVEAERDDALAGENQEHPDEAAPQEIEQGGG